MQQINTIIYQLQFKQFDYKYRLALLEHYQIKNSMAAFAIFVFLIIANFFGYFKLISLIIFTLIYPIYKTLELYSKIELKQAQLWISYWLMLSIIYILQDQLSQIVLFEKLKYLLIMFLYHPRFEYSKKIFDLIQSLEFSSTQNLVVSSYNWIKNILTSLSTKINQLIR